MSDLDPAAPAAGGPPQTLLFLIADTGGGHRASATAVARHMTARWPGTYDIHVLDPFAETSPRLVSRWAAAYGPLIRHAPWAWGAMYHATNSRAGFAALRGTVLRQVRPGLAHAIGVLRPAVVVSFHPLLNHVAATVLAGLAPRRPPLVTVVTDLNDAHVAWACEGADAVVVPSPAVHDVVRRSGVAADRCFELGLPVDDRFTAEPPTPEQRRQLRQRLGLDPDRFTVVMVGGGDGSGGLDHRARALARADGLDIQLVVVCGRNQRILDRLAGLRDHRGRAVILKGFVDDMPDWLRSADLLLTKAGPGSIAEALCCGVPMLIASYLPGQERGNVDLVVATGCGRFVPGTWQMVDAVTELSRPGSAVLAAMRAAVEHAARPHSTEQIAALIADHVRRSPAAVPAAGRGA